MADTANYACETTRETIHADLDSKYSKPRGSESDVEIASVQEGKGKTASVVLTGDSLKASGTVVLDGDGWRNLAKHASRRAQAQAR